MLDKILELGNMETIFNLVAQFGGFLIVAVFFVAIWKLLSRNNAGADTAKAATGAEKVVYELLKDEVTRLGQALQDADEQLKTLRKKCEEEHVKRDEEIAVLRHEHYQRDEEIRILKNEVQRLKNCQENQNLLVP